MRVCGPVSAGPAVRLLTGPAGRQSQERYARPQRPRPSGRVHRSSVPRRPPRHKGCDVVHGFGPCLILDVLTQCTLWRRDVRPEERIVGLDVDHVQPQRDPRHRVASLVKGRVCTCLIR